jgi:hypothetical protein
MVVAAVPGARVRTELRVCVHRNGHTVAGPRGRCAGLPDHSASVGERRLSAIIWSVCNGNDDHGSRGKRNNGLSVL